MKKQKAAAEDFLACESIKAKIVELQRQLSNDKVEPQNSVGKDTAKKVFCTSLTIDRSLGRKCKQFNPQTLTEYYGVMLRLG